LLCKRSINKLVVGLRRFKDRESRPFGFLSHPGDNNYTTKVSTCHGENDPNVTMLKWLISTINVTFKSLWQDYLSPEMVEISDEVMDIYTELKECRLVVTIMPSRLGLLLRPEIELWIVNLERQRGI
jgi:hypothetical protein